MTISDGGGARNRAVLAPSDGPSGSSQVSAEAVTWAIRLFAGREPVDASEVRFHQAHASLQNLRAAFAQIPDFQTFYATAVRREKLPFGIPPTMLRPAPEGLGWRLEPPLIDLPVCQLCTAAQFGEPVFVEIAQALGMAPRLSRRVWEQVYVVAVLAQEERIAPRARALALGVERERVAALLASRGMEVTAIGQAGRTSPHETRDGLHLFYPEVVSLEDFEQLVAYGEADLRGEPDLAALSGGGFDVVWSCGAAGQAGSIAAALGFVERSMDVLRPGGIAVHTLDFNIASEEKTVETEALSVPRRPEIESLLLRLAAAGHQVAPLNLHPGHDAADGIVDVVPYGLPHLKAEVGGHVVTSLGLTIRKAA